MRTSLRLATVTAFALCATMTGCGDDTPGGPSAEVLRVDVNGPSSIAPGQSASYSVIEYLSDGSTRALPNAAWSSSNPSLVQVTQGGVATAQPRTGETVLMVKTTRTAAKEVMVLPTGTFRLVGTVTDADLANLAIPDARVEVVGGPSTTTNGQGQYRLYGVPPDAELRVTREGYRTFEERVQLTSNTSRSFRLGVDGASRNFAGNYTLVLQASATCPGSSQLSAELKRRSYDATISQSGATLEVVLTEPRFFMLNGGQGNRFRGSITPTGATFTLVADYYYYFADVVERLPDGTRLTIGGRATTTGGPAGLSGSMSGWFSHMAGYYQYLGGCSAGTFALTPR